MYARSMTGGWLARRTLLLMQRALPAISIALLIGVIGSAAWGPILVALPCSDDAAFHLLRLTQLDALLRQGVWFSRWAPDMAQGYGYPLFNFYAPLSYYAAALVTHLGAGLNFGLRLTFALSIWGAGLSTYRLTRDFASRPAALAAATAILYAPYLGYDVYFRGNLAESVAWALLPLSLWTLGRLARAGGWGWLAAAAGSYAAVLLTHNVFALIFTPLLVAFGLLLWWLSGGERRRLGLMGWALALGLGLAAFFWLPALAERAYVHSDRLLVPPIFVYWNNFITLGEIFAWPRPIHPDLINPSPPRALGMLPFLLLLPALAHLRRAHAHRALTVFCGAALLVAIFLMTAASEPVWANLPLLEFVQFPWRLLGPAAICLALLLALAVDAWAPGRAQLVAALAAVTLLALGSLFWFTPRYCPGLAQPTAADIQLFEQQTSTIGTTAKGEYVPRGVVEMPAQPAAAPFTWPDGVTQSQVLPQAVGAAALIEAAAPVTVTANLFYYPGWQAVVDGEPVPAVAAPRTGLVTFPVPAGPHELRVVWRETPLRLAADLVSAASLSGVLLLAFLSRRRRARPPEAAAAGGTVESLRPFWMLALLLAAGIWLLPRVSSPLRHALLQNGEIQRDITPLNIQFNDGLRLLGYEQRQAQPGVWRYDLYWTVTQSPSRPYQTTLNLVDDAGQLWSAKASELPRDFRQPYDTRAWLPGQVAIDSHLLTPLPGTPPRSYGVELHLFDKESLALLSPAGQNAAPVPLAQVQVTPLLRPPDEAALDMAQPTHVAWEAVTLLGYNVDRREARPGDPFQLTLFWQATGTPAADLRARLTLLDPGGAAVIQLDLPPVHPDWPTMQWQAGDVWRGQHGWRMPASLASGVHHWILQLCPSADACAGPTADLGTLQIELPDRQWTAPTFQRPVGLRLGDVAELVGFSAHPDANAGVLTVALVWRALAETDTSYRVFVHLLDPAGQLVAQADGEPVNWTRPTTGWLPDEFLVDPYLLPLPPTASLSDYQLSVGLYDPANGARLPLMPAAGAPPDDHILLPLH